MFRFRFLLPILLIVAVAVVAACPSQEVIGGWIEAVAVRFRPAPKGPRPDERDPEVMMPKLFPGIARERGGAD